MKRPQFPFPQYQAIPLSPDDLIQVEAISSTTPITLDIEGTCLNNDGVLVPFQAQLPVPTALTPTILRFRLGYLFLLSCVVHCRDAGVPDGSCYIRLTLVNDISGGFYPNRKVLSEGYISTYASVGYGSAQVNGAPTDHYYVDNIAITQPAAGANFSYVCPDYTRLNILNLMGTLTNDANVATRRPIFTLTRPSAGTHQFRQGQDQTAGQTAHYCLNQTNSSYGLINPNASNGMLPILFLEPGCTIASAVNSIQVGDQWSNISLFVLRRTIPFT